MGGSSDHAPVASLKPFEVTEGDFPPDIRAEFEPILREMAGLGFVDPVFHVIMDPLNSTDLHFATLRHESGTAWARIQRRKWNFVRPPKIYLFANYFTRNRNGSWLFSTSGKRDTQEPPPFRVNRHHGMDATSLWKSHQQALASSSAGESTRVDSREELLEQIEAAHSDFTSYHLKRGFFQKPDEIAQRSLAMAQGGSGILDENASIRMEMEKIAFGKPSWGNFAAILVLSLIAFIGTGFGDTGGGGRDWKFLAMLVPILLIHELGHYVAMRGFGYRNLRMFFIPFFGAAVSGKHYNVAGWKKAVVSLAGPVPSIAIAIAVGAVGLLLHKSWLTHAAFVSIFINTFNLLPVLPLDGGWVLHSTLFTRHPKLDTAFRILAILGLFLLAHFLKARAFFFIALISITALPVSYKLAVITADLRKRNISRPEDTDEGIPTETANTIIDAVKSKFPTGVSRKAIAQHALNVFETVNAKPPGAPATLGILAVHAATVVVAILFGFVFAVASKQTLMSDAFDDFGTDGGTEIECGSSLVWRGPEWSDSRSNDLMVAAFPKRSDAQTFFQKLTNDLPPTASITCFGNSLLVGLAAAKDEDRSRWLDALNAGTTNVFVSEAGANYRLWINFQPAEGSKDDLEHDFSSYFSLPNVSNAVPPWALAARFSDEEQQNFQRARRTWSVIQNTRARAYTNPAVRAFDERIAIALKRGESNRAKNLQKEKAAEHERTERNLVESLKRDPMLDTSLVEESLALPPQDRGKATNRAYVRAVENLAPRFGTLKSATNSPANGVVSGWSFATKTRMSITIYVAGNSTADVLALTDWLCAKGCTGLKYSLDRAGSAGEDDEDE